MATLLLVAGVVVLLRSLNKHLRKVRVNPPAEELPGNEATTSETATTEATTSGDAPTTES